MPLIKIHTSAPERRGEEATAILKSLSAELASLLGKPEDYVMTCLVPAAMTFAGDTAPCALVEVANLGELERSKTEEMTAAICRVLEAELEVPSRRIYVEFRTPPRHYWGWDRKTFAT